MGDPNQYDNLGNEPLEDLTVLCKFRHEQEHRQISSRKRFEKGLETYATRKCGEDWQHDYSYDEIAEEYQEWLDDMF